MQRRRRNGLGQTLTRLPGRGPAVGCARGRPGAGPLRADARGHDEGHPDQRPGPGYLAQQREPGHQGERGLQAHQGAERRGGQPPQRVHLQAERHHRQQQRQAEAGQQQVRRQRGPDARPGDQRRHQGGHRNGHRQALQARDLVADRLGQDDVAGPARRRAEGAGDAGHAGTALPRVGQDQHAGRGEAWPQQPPAAPAAGDGHRERAQEFQRAGRAERQPGHGGHEQHGHPCGHHAESDHREQDLAREAPGPGPHGGQQDHPGPGQSQPDRSQRADLAEQRDGQCQAELDAGHRAHRHHGASPGRRPGPCGGDAHDGQYTRA